MTALVLFFLSAFGFAFVVGHSKISLPFRQLLGGWTESSVVPDIVNGEVLGQVVPHKPLVPFLGPFLVTLAECPGCLGWWLGAVAGWCAPMLVLAAAPTLMDLDLPLSFTAALVLSFSTSAVNLVLAKVTGIL